MEIGLGTTDVSSLCKHLRLRRGSFFFLSPFFLRLFIFATDMHGGEKKKTPQRNFRHVQDSTNSNPSCGPSSCWADHISSMFGGPRRGWKLDPVVSNLRDPAGTPPDKELEHGPCFCVAGHVFSCCCSCATNDQDSDVSFEIDNDEEMDAAVIEEEDWVEYIKRSTNEAIEKMENEKISYWKMTQRKMKWRLAMRIETSPNERW